MILNIINSWKVCYYNFLVHFYLCFNSIFPYYNDVIINMQLKSIKILLEKNNLSFQEFKKIKMLAFFRKNTTR